MKKGVYICLSVLVVFVLGIYLPKWILRDIPEVSKQDVSYAKNIARQILDNPIEKIFIVEMVITKSSDGVFMTESYLWGGIPYATVEVFYDKGANVTWRRFFNDYEKKQTVRFSDTPIELKPESVKKNDGTITREDFITSYLESESDFAWKTVVNGQNICVYENLGNEEDLFPLSLWVRCSEFVVQENKLVEESGMSGPALIDYPNILSFYDYRKMSHITPRDGNLYVNDIRNIFPVKVQEKIFQYHKTSTIHEKLIQFATQRLLSE